MADRNKNTEIFREKSIQRISSPDDLDRYIKSTKPSLWLILCSIIILLVGVIVWASVGKIEACSTVGCKVSDGEMISYITEADYEELCDESYVEVNEKAYKITAVTGPILLNDESDTFLSTAAGLNKGDWYYILVCETNLGDGSYKGKAVFELVSPLKFIIN